MIKKGPVDSGVQPVDLGAHEPKSSYSGALPALPSVREIQRRLGIIFPETFPDRTLLVGTMAARVVFVFLYGGCVEGADRYLRPSHIYLFTDGQSKKTSESARREWISLATRPGFRPAGKRWYADTSREPIRDDLMRNQFLKRLGVMHKKPGAAITASTPINYLDAEFAALFAPSLSGRALEGRVARWRERHLDAAILQRMALRGEGLQKGVSDVFVEMPDETRIRIASGPSALIVKGLIEEFAQRHLANPAVLWLSASDKKSYPQFVELAAKVGLRFDLSAELPDLILADLSDPPKFFLCEVVATDGAVTEERRRDLLHLVGESSIPESAVRFLTAFEEREATAFRKNFSALAINSLVWFRTEPDLLVALDSADRHRLFEISR
ncbi:MAG: hypothetical protein KIS74_06535 [Burkholderiales bacterium]|nr:hypothetical protein [Burkholderiales bacterium]